MISAAHFMQSLANVLCFMRARAIEQCGKAQQCGIEDSIDSNQNDLETNAASGIGCARGSG